MFLKKIINDRSGILFLSLLSLFTIAVPCLNLMVPQGNVFHVSTYTMAIFGKYLTYALLAVSVDLIWGYMGILSLGHSAFFALGGYGMGMYLMRQIGTRGEYGHPILPDFMVFLNWSELPWFWHGFNWFGFAMVMAVLVPVLLAMVFGWFAFKSRVSGVYLSIITQALTYSLMLAFFRNEMGFGGNNGLTDFKDILGFSLQSDTTRAALFALSGAALGLGYLACHFIVNSKLGRVCRAIRDAEDRTLFIGYRVAHVQLAVFAFSAALAAVAGILYVPQVGIINPSEFSPLNGIEIVVWVAVGGRATLFGAVIGALTVNYAKSFLTAAMPEIWLFALGALFIFVTLFLPDGIAGFFNTKQHPKKIPGAGTNEEKTGLPPTPQTQTEAE